MDDDLIENIFKLMIVGAGAYVFNLLNKQPYHDSKLSGHDYYEELLNTKRSNGDYDNSDDDYNCNLNWKAVCKSSE